MNDLTPLPNLPAAKPINHDLVNLLEAALSRVRSGKTVGIGLVEVLGPDALSMGSSGAFPSTLAAGCTKLAQMTIDNMFKQRSSLLLPPGRQN